MLGAPDAAQRGGGVAVEGGGAPGAVKFDEPAGEHAHVGGGEIQALRAGRWHDMRRIARQKQTAKAHIVPPTGAKGLNLAASDVNYLSSAFISYYIDKTDAGIDGYSARALRRIWKAERFSWSLTTLMHRFADSGSFGQKIQEAELDYLVHSKAASTALAENYVGLPL